MLQGHCLFSRPTIHAERDVRDEITTQNEQMLTKAAGMIKAMTETVIKEEFNWAAIGWNSWERNLNPPTAGEREVLSGSAQRSVKRQK